MFDGHGFWAEGSYIGVGWLDVWGSAPDDVYVVGGSSGREPRMTHYDGQMWNTIDTAGLPASSVKITRVWGLRKDYVIVAVDTSEEPDLSGAVFSYSQGQWQELVVTDGSPCALWADVDEVHVAVINDDLASSTLHSFFEGAWSQKSLPGLFCAIGGHSQTIAMGTSGDSTSVTSFDRSMGQWSEPADIGPDTGPIHGLWAFNDPSGGPDIAVAVGDSAIAVEDASSWTVASDIQVARPLRDVSGTGPDNVYAVGDQGYVLHFDGRAWSPVDVQAGSLLGVYFIP